MKFSESVKVGRVGEELVKQILEWAGVNTQFNDSTDIATLKKHDIKCKLNGVVFSVESKFDDKQKETGNLAVEYFNPRTKKPSGLMATTADLWAVVLNPCEVWVCRTKDLKRYFNEVKPIKEVPRAGDGNASLRLFRSEEILSSIFVRLDLEAPWEVLSIISCLLSKRFSNGTTTRVADSVQNFCDRQWQGTGVANRNCAG